MSSLLGIALVVDDINKGCNLAFRYPAPPSSMDHVSSFHKLSPALFAKLFRPKNALCNQSFELVVDDLRFVSHPVLVSRRAHASPASAVAPSIATNATAAAANAAAIAAGAMSSSSLVSANGSASASASASSAATAAATANTAASATSRTETTMFNIVFALEELSQLEHEDEELVARRRRSISAFRTVAAQLANGLLHEELRSGFVSNQVRELLHMRDELAQHERSSAAAANGSGAGSSGTGAGAGSGSAAGGSTSSSSAVRKNDSSNGEASGAGVDVDPQTFIDVSLGKSVLANDLKSVFHGLDESGTAHVVINRWVKLSLTLTDSVAVKMPSLRPYHTLLLLADDDKILDALPTDHSQQLRRLIAVANPLKSFQELALETSIPIHQVFRLSAHLVYWGFGKVIDTITLRNIYHVNPQASVRSHSALALEFRRKFVPHELSEVLSSFSGSRAISEHMKNLSTLKKTEYIHMLIWLLQQNFIVQLHRYVYFMIPSDGDHASGDHDAARDRTSSSFGTNNSFGSNQLASQSHHHTPSRTSSFLSALEGTSGAHHTPREHARPPFMTSTVSSAATTAPLLPLRPSTMATALPAPATTTPTNPFALSDHEREYLDRIATTNPVYTLFKRLCVYFHGQYHLEEIMWRENVSRSELRTVLSTYQDIIVCCLHA